MHQYLPNHFRIHKSKELFLSFKVGFNLKRNVSYKKITKLGETKKIEMFFLILCLLFIIRLRFATGKSIAEIIKHQ